MVLLELSSEEGYDFRMMGYDFARPMVIWFPDRKHIWFYYGIWFCLANFLLAEMISRWDNARYWLSLFDCPPKL